MGKVCICGASALNIDYRAKTMSVNGTVLSAKATITFRSTGRAGRSMPIDCATAPSEIIQGLLHGDKAAQKAETYRNFNQLMDWCSKVTRMSVRTNADNAGAGGKCGGIWRQRHWSLPDRTHVFRGQSHRRHAPNDPGAQSVTIGKRRWPNCCRIKGRFRSAFSKRSKEDRPRFVCSIRRCTNSCRRITPPKAALADKIGVSTDEIARRVHELHEQNPMLGHRGCRLGISYPGVTEMQARAIFEAAAEVQKSGIKVKSGSNDSAGRL